MLHYEAGRTSQALGPLSRRIAYRMYSAICPASPSVQGVAKSGTSPVGHQPWRILPPRWDASAFPALPRIQLQNSNMSQSTVSGALACGAYRRAHGPDRIRPCCCGKQLYRPHAGARSFSSKFSRIRVELTGGYIGLGSLPYQALAQACHSSPHAMWLFLSFTPKCQTSIEALNLLQSVSALSLAF